MSFWANDREWSFRFAACDRVCKNDLYKYVSIAFILVKLSVSYRTFSNVCPRRFFLCPDWPTDQKIKPTDGNEGSKGSYTSKNYINGGGGWEEGTWLLIVYSFTPSCKCVFRALICDTWAHQRSSCLSKESFLNQVLPSIIIFIWFWFTFIILFI